jgi:hypothetical protein
MALPNHHCLLRILEYAVPAKTIPGPGHAGTSTAQTQITTPKRQTQESPEVRPIPIDGPR